MALFLPSTILGQSHVFEEVRRKVGHEGDAALKLMTKANRLVFVQVKLFILVVVALRNLERQGD